MKLKTFIALFISFFLLSNKAISAPRCEELWKTIYNDELRKDVNLYKEQQKTIGIRLDKIWVSANNENNPHWGTWDLKENKDGYFSVGKITKGNLSEEIKVGDIVLSINDIDLRETAKNEDKKELMESDISDLFEENELIKFKLMRKNKKTNRMETFVVDRTHKDQEKPNIKNTIENFNSPAMDFYIKSININEKEGNFDASIETSFLEVIDERYFLTKAIWDHLVYDKKYKGEKLKRFWYERCSFSDERWQKLNTVDPNYGMVFDNLIKEERQNRYSEYHIEPDISNDNYYEEGIGDDWEYFTDSAIVIYKSKSLYKIKNDFNLKTFPFDTQKLSIYLRDDLNDIDESRSMVTSWTMKRALEFKEANSIQGWDITNVGMDYEIYDDPTDYLYKDGFKLVFTVERKSGYYLFKIILPMILILSICWSAVWIDPKEIESRLTITIVCLLSLIAYNFVIDSELPKLEYLTIMDYIILLSYVYATIPNFLSIYSFQLIKKDKILARKYENLEKKLGLPSYILMILIIIMVNTNTNPEHTSSLFSWALMR